MVRTEQRAVDNDRAVATSAVLADDGFTLGIMFKGEWASAPPGSQATTSLVDIDRQFVLPL